MTRLLLISALACSLAPARASAGAELDPVTRAALGRLPYDIALIGSIDVGGAILSPAGKRLLDAALRESGMRRALAELRRASIDARTVARVWLVLPASALAGGPDYAFLAELDADRQRFAAWLRRRGGRDVAERKLGAVDYYVLDDAAWAFLDARHMVFAHPGYIEEVLRAATGQKHAALANRALVDAVLAAGRPPGAHAWLAAVVPDPTRAELRKDPHTAALADVSWIAGHVTLSGETRWLGQAKVARAGAGQAVSAALKQMIDVAAPELARAGLADAAAATTVVAERDAVRIEGSLPVPAAASARPRVMR